MSKFTETFAAAMRAARENSNISQHSLASMVGCSIDTIGNVERGDTAPSVEILVGIAHALSLDVQAMIVATAEDTTARTAKPAIERTRGRQQAEAAVVAGTMDDKTLAVWIEIGRLLKQRGL